MKFCRLWNVFRSSEDQKVFSVVSWCFPVTANYSFVPCTSIITLVVTAQRIECLRSSLCCKNDDVELYIYTIKSRLFVMCRFIMKELIESSRHFQFFTDNGAVLKTSDTTGQASHSWPRDAVQICTIIHLIVQNISNPNIYANLNLGLSVVLESVCDIEMFSCWWM